MLLWRDGSELSVECEIVLYKCKTGQGIRVTSICSRSKLISELLWLWTCGEETERASHLWDTGVTRDGMLTVDPSGTHPQAPSRSWILTFLEIRYVQKVTVKSADERFMMTSSF